MAYASGRLRKRVRIERPVLTQDPTTGENTTTWTAVDTVWAAIRSLTAKEFIQSAANQSEVTGAIEIRYRTDVLPTYRLVHVVNGVDGKIYNPAAFMPDNESGLEYLVIPVTEGVNTGE